MAKPGSVLLTAETLQLAEGYVQVKPLGPVAVKGLAAPMEVFELAGAGPTRPPLQAFAARGLTRFVGRQLEVEALCQALGHAAAGRGQLVAVIGEPGVGKSRLCYEFTHSHRTHGWLVLESSSVSYGQATAYLPSASCSRPTSRLTARDEALKIRAKVTGKLVTLEPALEAHPASLPHAPRALPVEDPAWQALDPPNAASAPLRPSRPCYCGRVRCSPC